MCVGQSSFVAFVGFCLLFYQVLISLLNGFVLRPVRIVTSICEGAILHSLCCLFARHGSLALFSEAVALRFANGTGQSAQSTAPWCTVANRDVRSVQSAKALTSGLRTTATGIHDRDSFAPGSSTAGELVP
jgi:hypothetical protein